MKRLELRHSVDLYLCLRLGYRRQPPSLAELLEVPHPPRFRPCSLLLRCSQPRRRIVRDLLPRLHQFLSVRQGTGGEQATKTTVAVWLTREVAG